MKKTNQCFVCGQRFSMWRKRAPTICRPCGELAAEIAKVAGPEFVNEKSIVAARNRNRLIKPVLEAFTVRLIPAAAPSPAHSGINERKS